MRSAAEGGIDPVRAWLNAGAAFVSTFVVFGIGYSFGAFFTPISREFHTSSGATSVVFSVTAACWFLLGLVTGRAGDRWGPRPLLLVGAVALVCGLQVIAHAHTVWLAYLAHGLGVGVAAGCGYIPMVAAVGGSFSRRRGLALGVAVSGIGAGTLFGAPVAAVLIAAYGWRTAYQIFGFAGAAALVGCALVTTTPPVQAAAAGGGSGAGRLVRDRRFRALYVSTVCSSLALFVPFVFLPAFATANGTAPIAAASLMGVVGVASVVGRLAIGPVAERIGYLRSYRFCFGIMAASYIVWLAVSGYPALVAFAAILGVGYGGWIALGPAVMAELFGTEGLGGTLGLAGTGSAIGVLVGPPLAGLLIDATGGYRWAIALAAALATAAALALLPLRGAHGPGRPGR
ncbi:MFS transporter [Pseudonocardia acaciae]|uniref:MFS transporter n=1 Tax=Pseudonocardia acaciae TaxID=551276 RepID=UPI00055DA8C6|nr:MFS transporter [Pseudonocardia acaciae]